MDRLCSAARHLHFKLTIKFYYDTIERWIPPPIALLFFIQASLFLLYQTFLIGFGTRLAKYSSISGFS